MAYTGDSADSNTMLKLTESSWQQGNGISQRVRKFGSGRRNGLWLGKMDILNENPSETEIDLGQSSCWSRPLRGKRIRPEGSERARKSLDTASSGINHHDQIGSQNLRSPYHILRSHQIRQCSGIWQVNILIGLQADKARRQSLTTETISIQLYICEWLRVCSSFRIFGYA
jgi:hypothetical protein